MTTVAALLAFPEDLKTAAQLAEMIGATAVPIERHTFPDQEILLTFSGSLPEDCAVFCALDRPNPKYLPLILAAEGARKRGAKHLGLIAPYLPYMRQDNAFEPGQLVSARILAGELSRHFDWLVTVDPHLHRIRKLEEVFSIPCAIAHAAQPIANWISTNMQEPVLIGPDSESAQWVSSVADLCGAPYTTLSKSRHGDVDVVIERKELLIASKKPILIDDIVSTAETMVAAVELIRAEAHLRPHCIAVHGIFAPGAFERLVASGPQSIVTTNAILHPSNGIDITGAIAEAVSGLPLVAGRRERGSLT
jgi:ribose-phosphate pyrophosphokinase